jgi:hypothetical protein
MNLDLKKTGQNGIDWIHLAQEMCKLQVPENMAMNHLIP